MGAVTVAAGADPDYYKREVVEAREAAMERGYYSKAVVAGEPEGVLLGLGLERLGLTVGSEVTEQVSATLFGKLQDPTTGQALGRAMANYASPGEVVLRQAAKAGLAVAPEALAAARENASPRTGVTRAQALDLVAAVPGVTPEEVTAVGIAATKGTQRNVNYYDTCFTSDKTISVAHAAADAVGDSAASDVFEQAMVVASEVMVGTIDEVLAYTRPGTHGKSVGGRSGGRYAKAEGVSCAVYRHHTSREGDMHDHFHTLVLNRSRDDSGKYHALDGTMIFNSVHLLTALASRAQELTITGGLGYRWEKNPDGSRRLAGVDAEVCEQFSKRGAAIEARLDEWERKYELDNGVAPTKKQRDGAHRRIQRSTRKAKSEHHEVRGDVVAKWSDELDKSRGTSLGEVYESLQDRAGEGRKGHEDHSSSTEVFDGGRAVSEALDTLNAQRSSYSRSHLAWEIDRALPANLPTGMTIERYREVLDNLTNQAIERAGVDRLTPIGVIDRDVPVEMAAPDGRSAFTPPADEVYASVEQLARESYLVGQARTLGAPRVSVEVAAALAGSAGLYEDQAAAFRAILTSGRSLEVLIGPAGTGKSYTVGHLAKAWNEVGYGGQVIGLALSEAATRVLKGEGIEHSFNLARWRKAQRFIESGRPRPGDKAMEIRRGALVIIDEAGMADTAAIAAVTKAAEAVGAKVVLTGDHHQVAAVEAGGVMALLAEDESLRREGAISELVEVQRFTATWEGPASLRLREGDTSVLETYDRAGRIVEVESLDEAMEAVYDSWLIDTLGAKTSIMVTATTEEAAALATRARAELIELGRVSNGASVELANGSLASTGDVIEARKNDRKITDQHGEPISNRDRLVVQEVRDDGTLWVTREGSKARLSLPPEYVGQSVELGYAVTVHGAQGRTVDSSYVLGSEALSAETLYVALSRGREMNRVVVPTIPGAGGHSHDAGEERTALGLLSGVMERSSAELSATAKKHQLVEASESLARIGPVWSEAVARLDEDNAPMRKAVADVLGPELMARVDHDPAAPAFWRTVTLTAQAGTDPIDALRSTLAGREVATGSDVAALLTWRITTSSYMAWEPETLSGAARLGLVPETYLERTQAPPSLGRDSLAGDSVGAYARRLAVAMDNRTAELGRRAAQKPPAWATLHLGAVPAEGTSSREVWESRAGRVEAYREQYVTTKAIGGNDPIGRAPNGRSAPERYADWKLANAALGRDADLFRDVSTLPDVLLRHAVETWTTEQQSAPTYVRHELDRAGKDALRARSQAEREVARSGAKPGPHTMKLVAKAEELERYSESLRQMQVDRDEWFDRTAEMRTTAREAESELARRYPEGDPTVEEPKVVQVPEEMETLDLARYERTMERNRQQQQINQRDRSTGLGVGLTP